MTEEPDNNKWKENLLKSSLPLEQLVAEQLEQNEFYIAGEYPYIRPNEQGIRTEFSIDLHSSKSNGKLVNKDLIEIIEEDTFIHLLIECKYTHPSVQWVFSPYIFSHYVPYPINCLHEECSSPVLEGSPHLLGNSLPVCRRGIALSQNSFDPNVISHGLNQLYYGLPNLVITNLKPSLQVKGAETHICICPILVTTARLYILKIGQSLDAFFSAKSLEVVADQVNALFIMQEQGPALTQYCEDLVLESLTRGLTTKSKETLILMENAQIKYFQRFFSYPFTAIVVNLNVLKDLLKDIELSSFSKLYPSARKGNIIY